MLDVLPTAHERAQQRFDRFQERSIKNFGWGDTYGALAIAEAVLPRLTSAIEDALAQPLLTAGAAELNPILAQVRHIPAEQIALCTLQSLMHCIAADFDYRQSVLVMGRELEHEVYAQCLQQYDAKLFKRVSASVEKRHGSLKYRRTSARAAAKRAGFTFKRWSVRESAKIGGWVLLITCQTLPDIFVVEEHKWEEKIPTISEGAIDIADKLCQHVMNQRVFHTPKAEPPANWTGWLNGPSADPHTPSVVRTRHRQTELAVREAIRIGQMQPALDALNTIQATPWKINRRILDVQIECYQRGLQVPGLPAIRDMELPAKPTAWAFMTAQEQALWKLRASDIKRANRGLVSDRISYTEDSVTAQALRNTERFYTKCNLDWRGRVYPIPHFNFAREDRVRALFLFADGEPIGPDGIYWLKVHTANCGDFAKISKRSIEERAQWVDSNAALISQTATDPLAPSSLRWWTQADKPFLFLAACMELHAIFTSPTPERFVSALPVSWDGSCSGLQHLCAMTRASEGQFVNLTPSELPQDVYQKVADACATRVREDAADEMNWTAQVCNKYGITRALVKRNVMTYSYSSKKFGMAQQLIDDEMRPLKLKVIKGELEEHPFGSDDGASASKYLAARIFESIEEIVELPAKAMGFLQELARAAAAENKPLTWTTPTGLPWMNRYHAPVCTRVKLWLHDRGVRVMHRLLLAVGSSRKIDKIRAANGVSPNFVHACDAAHLMLTVNAAAREEGMHCFALVHDSFGCHASRAKRFRSIIREQFVQMYEQHDVLAEVLEQAQRDLTDASHAQLPEPVVKGNLNIKDVLHAEYAFA